MKKVIVIGAGPAGLTAAYEILNRTDSCQVLVLEEKNQIGGLAKTVDFQDYRMDLGGHRFLMVNEKVLDWWNQFLPSRGVNYIKRMFQRKQKLKLYYKGNYVSHPILFDRRFRNQVGSFCTLKCICGLIKSKIKKRKEHTLEDYYMNRFGQTIYQTFLQDYMEKCWGESLRNLSCEQGTMHGENRVQTEYFLYPKLGAGQMWQEVAEKIKKRGGIIELGAMVDSLVLDNNMLKKISYIKSNGKRVFEEADVVISTMPLSSLFANMTGSVPISLRMIANGLKYRDCVIMGLCIKWPELSNGAVSIENFPECMIYVQDPKIKLARIQVYNNWSPYLVKKKNELWMGLEFFCKEGDNFWNLSEDECAKIAVSELKKIGFIESGREVVCYHREYVPKAYPAYAGSYEKKGELLSFVDGIKNLYTIGRNGSHYCYKMDETVLNAMQAVDKIFAEHQK